ncbi:hypothetical protein OWV82_022790 [Melia azedarach]|uniref:Uncharacterized protein n=1 Tax=Melia azedarach TaxID=155640 RepID=A0ACC1WV13_MELAZ|nr:hypothetical protein OWV82_022790 [Melia azedarach]
MASPQSRATINSILLLISLILLTKFVPEAESRPLQTNDLNLNDIEENTQVNDIKAMPPVPFQQIPPFSFPPFPGFSFPGIRVPPFNLFPQPPPLT